MTPRAIRYLHGHPHSNPNPGCRLKKIKCNRQHPQCLQCHQSRLGCSWTNKGKKPNQTKKLVSDFEKLGNRLESLENKVDQLSSAINQLPDRLLGNSEKYQKRQASFRESTQRSLQPKNTLEDQATPRHHGDEQAGYVIAGPQGEQRHHGASSLLSLLLQSDATIDANLRQRTSLKRLLLQPLPEGQEQEDAPSWHDFLQYKDRVYRKLSRDLASHSLAPDISSDQLPPLLPPRHLLEGLLDGYFRHTHPVTPLLSRGRVEKAIAHCYAVQPEQADLGWIILFNYIVIRSLAGRHVLEQPMTDVNVVATGNQFDQPFVQNIRRAFYFLDHLKKPTLTNVQALGALVLVSQKHFSFYTTQMLLNQTCHLAKSIGLHQHQPADGETDEETQDRTITYWLLFTLDKDISLLLGATPELPMYDCDIALPEHVSSDQQQRIQACIIEERIYIALYSASGSRKTAEQKERAVEELERDLDQFESLQSNLDPEDPMSGWRGKPFLQLEMKFIYHQLRVMVLRCSEKPENKRRCLDEARLGITDLSNLRLARTTIGGSMVLRRPFQWHSFAPFFELFFSLFHHPISSSQLSDFSLLKNCVSILGEVAGLDSPITFCATLLRVFTACMDIAQAFIQQSQAYHHTETGTTKFDNQAAGEKRTFADMINSETDSEYQESRRPRVEQQQKLVEGDFDPFFR